MAGDGKKGQSRQDGYQPLRRGYQPTKPEVAPKPPQGGSGVLSPEKSIPSERKSND